MVGTDTGWKVRPDIIVGANWGVIEVETVVGVVPVTVDEDRETVVKVDGVELDMEEGEVIGEEAE